MEKIRLNKYLSEKGVCSRREADRLVDAGEILINGELAAMGARVNDEDTIYVSGKEVLKQRAELVILAVNKPKGVVCTTAEFESERNIVDMVKYPTRVYPVGRLDKNSEGLIFLTNDGEFMNQLLKASNGHEKEYNVEINQQVTEELISKMSNGLYLPELDKTTHPCRVEKTGNYTFKIVLTQGLNRQIRRMCDVCGCKVVSLRRTRIMNIHLGNLKSGSYRKLEGVEKSTLLSRVMEKTETKMN